jgi:HAD superfamily hydrolase (TIGR01549 family)
VSIRAVIFDLDGTITRPFLDFDAIRKAMGLDVNAGPILEALKELPPHQRSQAMALLDGFEQEAVEQSELNPGARDVLAALRSQGLSIGILTRNKHDNACAVAGKHGLQFDCVVGRDDAPAKPDPQGVWQLCNTFSVDPAETLVVGDFLHDLLCAKAAGAVGVLLENHKNAQEFRQHAVFTIENLGQIMHIITGYDSVDENS